MCVIASKLNYIFAGQTRETARSSATRSSNRSSFTLFTTNSLESLRPRGARGASSTTRTDWSNLGLEERERVRSRTLFGSSLGLLQLLQEGCHVGRCTRWAGIAGYSGSSRNSWFSSLSLTARSTHFARWALRVLQYTKVNVRFTCVLIKWSYHS